MPTFMLEMYLFKELHCSITMMMKENRFRNLCLIQREDTFLGWLSDRAVISGYLRCDHTSGLN